MPIYIFRCANDKCNQIKEVFSDTIKDRPTAMICDKCGDSMFRSYSDEGMNFHLKGCGWFGTEGRYYTKGEIDRLDKELQEDIKEEQKANGGN